MAAILAVEFYVQMLILTFDLILQQHARKEVNVELKKEAEFFGDIVIVPYMDNYDLVVLKTVAICEYGVSCGSNTLEDGKLLTIIHRLTI